MKMVEIERKRSDEEHAILLKRIAFLTEELEETKRQLRVKVGCLAGPRRALRPAHRRGRTQIARLV